MRVSRVIILQEAVDDLKAGKSFYDHVEQGVGDYFWDSLVADIESLPIYAGVHAVEFGFHRMLAKRFPYAVYYHMEADLAQVVAILPLRRDPKWIERMMARRS